MISENAQKWVDALRSGKYKQTTGHLKDSNGYCCLGVACEVYIENGGELEVADAGWDQSGIVKFDGSASLPPRKVADWLGLQQPSGDYNDGREWRGLTNDNDMGVAFDKIADIIESNPQGLFKDA